MSSEHKVSTEHNEATAESVENNLISFEKDIDTQHQTRDINTKISSLEVDLQQLNSQLSSINASVEEGLDRLGDNDTDLTAKVSETYKRLGEIDNAYKELMNISMKLDTDILRVTQNVSEVAAQSVNGLKTLEQTSIEKNNELAERNQRVVSRVESLVESSRTTNELLHESIKLNTENMLALENKLVAEIEELADSTQANVDDIEMELASNKARIVKMQKVDEAIVRRATSLEITASELTQKTKDISASIQLLEDSTSDLTGKVVDLMVHTQKLQDESDKHSGLLNSLQTGASEMAASLLALTKTEHKHFRFTLISLLIVVIALASLSAYQYKMLKQESQQSALRADGIDEQISGLKLQDTQAVESLSTLEQRVGTMNQDVQLSIGTLDHQLKQEVSRLNQQVADINDQVDTLDGRLNNNVMFEKIGADNIIHGRQWLTALPAENYTIRLLTVHDKDELYEVAQSYNYYLTEQLSYLAAQNSQQKIYTLFYGNYENAAQARKALANLPGSLSSAKPGIVQLKELAL